MSYPAPVERDELQTHAPALRRYFRRRVPADAVDDLVQEVFVSVQARRAQSPIENMCGYLFAVASHVLLHHRVQARRDRSRLERIDEDTVVGVSDVSPERLVASRQDLKRLVVSRWASR